jgi:DNA-binding NarL/FixJ family response regulator
VGSTVRQAVPTELDRGEFPRQLSPREVEVLCLIAAGKSNREIAETLVISVNTVIRHVAHIFEKTGVSNRAEAAAYAMRHGLAG